LTAVLCLPFNNNGIFGSAGLTLIGWNWDGNVKTAK